MHSLNITQCLPPTWVQWKYGLRLGLSKCMYICIIRNLMGCVVLIHSGLVVNCKKLVTVMTVLQIDLAVGIENRPSKLVNNAISCVPKIFWLLYFMKPSWAVQLPRPHRMKVINKGFHLEMLLWSSWLFETHTKTARFFMLAHYSINLLENRLLGFFGGDKYELLKKKFPKLDVQT